LSGKVSELKGFVYKGFIKVESDLHRMGTKQLFLGSTCFI
jgi:hypothetical protein